MQWGIRDTGGTMVYMSKRILLGVATILWLLTFPHELPLSQAQDTTLLNELLSSINSVRIANNLPPFALNALLTQAAQGHSEWMASTGQITHDGAGGSRPIDRVLATGYPAVRVNENIYAGWQATPQTALNWWLGSSPHTANILHPVLREIGIGIAIDANETVYYTLNFSAQPRVIPIFVNNDAYATNSTSVTLTLWNDGVFSGGADEVIISNSPDFSNGMRVGWAQYIGWTLHEGDPGSRTVYVRFLNVGGTNVDSQDAIQYDPGASGNLPPATSVPTNVPLPTQLPATLDLPPQQPVFPTNAPLPLFTPTLAVSPTVTPTPDRLATSSLGNVPATRSSNPTITPSSIAPPAELPMTGAAGSSILPVNLLRTVLTATLILGLGAAGAGAITLVRARKHTSLPLEATSEHQSEQSDQEHEDGND